MDQDKQRLITAGVVRNDPFSFTFEGHIYKVIGDQIYYRPDFNQTSPLFYPQTILTNRVLADTLAFVSVLFLGAPMEEDDFFDDLFDDEEDDGFDI